MRLQRSQLGGGLLCLGGGIIAYVPLVVIPNTGMVLGAIGDGLLLVGASLGLLVACCGALALLKPTLSLYAGIAGVVLALCSFVGALGGLVLGALLSVVGGGLCISAGLEEADLAETVARAKPSGLFTAEEESTGPEPKTKEIPAVATDEDSVQFETAADEESFQFGTDSEADPAATTGSDEASSQTGTEPAGDTLFGTDDEN